MTRNNKTRHALLMSMMSILLCVAMLIGSTFAWFTDTASTSVNQIQAGTLDIELEMLTKDANENEATWKDAEGKTLSFKKASTASGTEVLWEPGCTYELPTLRVVNNGNLAFKYKIVVSGATGDTKLLEAIDFTVKFNGVEVNLDNWEGSLLPKGKTATSDTAEEVETSSFLVISGHMKEEAGNEYRGLSVDGIGITVYATQYTYEYDSYNNKYDLNSMYVFDDYVNVTKTVSADGDTVIKDKEENAAITATIPQGSLGEGITELALIKKPTENPSSVKVEIGESALTTDVKIINTATKEVISAQGDTYFTIDIQLGQVELLKFYHKGVELTNVESNEFTAAGQYKYDFTSGVVTFTTKEFSAFTAKIKYSGGDGTESYPYLMATANDLFSFAEITNNGTGYSGKYFKVTNNIDLGNEEWTPIGQKAGNKFNGTFDGNNKTVSGLKITSNNTVNNNESFDGYGALFGAIEGDAVVKNLTVSGTVTCASAAGIVARMNQGTVENCTSNVTVTGSEKAGGIVCLTNTSGCTIKNCTNNGTVSGPTTGGIAAMVNSNTTVEGCTNNGAIGGGSSQIAGGIVATINSKWTNVQIESCTNNAAVTSQSSGTLTGKSGGIVGSVETGAKSGCSGTIKNCSNSGTISSTGNKSASGGIVGDIEDDFGIVLTVENNECNSNDFSGKGTASDPYIIDSADKLSTLSANVASGKIYCYQYFKLSTDLDMTSASFTPIGNSTYSFKGMFDGNSKTISNLNISSSTGSEPLGLFVSTNRATIKNLTLNNVTVSGTTKVGALVGSMKGGTVENVKLTGTGNVTSSSYYAGGIIGYAESATISSCENKSTGEVKENTNNNSGVGGIIGGALKNTTVTNCTNSCKVSGTTNAGGIAGQVSAGTVSGCTNSGAVTVSKNYAGGIVGLAQLETVVSGNTNSGAVKATGNYAGGIVGAAVLTNKATGDMTISGNTNTGMLTATNDNYKNDIVAYPSDSSTSYSINVSGDNTSSQDGGSD